MRLETAVVGQVGLVYGSRIDALAESNIGRVRFNKNRSDFGDTIMSI